MKIKKDVKPQLSKLPALKIKYHLVVPFMGFIDMMTMLSFFMNPVFDGKILFRIFFAFFALVGLVFMYWGFMWKITADGKKIKVRPAFGRGKEAAFGDLKNAVIHKKAKSGTLVYYELMDREDQPIVKIYPLMKDSGLFLERLKRLSIPVKEVRDR